MNDPERVAFHSLGQRPEENGNSEEMAAGESEGVTKVDLRAIWPLGNIVCVGRGPEVTPRASELHPFRVLGEGPRSVVADAK
jgi:hypothetical protein